MAELPFSIQQKFVTFCALARRTIEMTSTPLVPLIDGIAQGPPPHVLPLDIRKLLSALLSIPLDAVSLLWDKLRSDVWTIPADNVPASDKDIEAFITEGNAFSIGYRHLYPPVNRCMTEGCPRISIWQSQRTTTTAKLFTLREGFIPTFRTRFYCPACNTSYLPNYYISKHYQKDGQTESPVSLRQYYPGVPQQIEVSTHTYLDAPLLELFANCQMFAWTSATNCSRIYNTCMRSKRSHIAGQALAYMSAERLPEMPNLSTEKVLSGFFIYSLLLDKAEHGETLVVINQGEARARLKEPLADRNKNMEGTGQEAYTHECDKCCYTFEENGKKYKISAAVSDGVTIGHPCCAVPDCKLPLENHTKRFCLQHKDLDDMCAVVGCTEKASSGHRTCSNSEHRKLEIVRAEANTAMFQLKKRLAKSRGTVALDSLNSTPGVEGELDDDEVMVEVDEDVDECDTTKPESGNRKLRALFGRRKTHNEQFMMRPCGVIISRCTFFASEAISGVYKYFKAVFPTPSSTPSYLMYDDNCHVKKHIKVIGCQHFNNTAFPVDVFHFKSKHTDKDLSCELGCNPVAFPELYDEDDNWRFNSSICEQTNVWINGFQSILSDMEVTRYNFYLDEMVKRHNRFVISELARKGANPRKIPLSYLGL